MLVRDVCLMAFVASALGQSRQALAPKPAAARGTPRAATPVALTDLCFTPHASQCTPGRAACIATDEWAALLASAVEADVGPGVALGRRCARKAACGDGCALEVVSMSGGARAERLAQCAQKPAQCQGLKMAGLHTADNGGTAFPLSAMVLPVAIVGGLCLVYGGVALLTYARQSRQATFVSPLDMFAVLPPSTCSSLQNTLLDVPLETLAEGSILARSSVVTVPDETLTNAAGHQQIAL